jgi:NitT/TauT family transport system permease protein
MLSRPGPGAPADLVAPPLPAAAPTRPESADRGRAGKVAPTGTGRARLKRIGYGIGGSLGLLLIAELFTRSGVIDPEYLPPVSTVLVRAVELGGDPAFLADVGATLAAWFVALVLATAIAVPCGVALGLSKVGYAASSSIINALRPIPGVALIPLAILVWGNGLGMKVGLAVFSIVWPILFNAMYGVRDVDPVAKETARSYGLRGLRLLRHVILPSAAPFILTGIRVAASVAFIVVVGTELFAGTQNGIGAFLLANTAGGGDIATNMAGAVWAGALGLIINLLLGQVDRHYFRWSRRGQVD